MEDGYTVKIRKLESADIPRVAALEKETFSEPWSEGGFADAISQPGNVFLVAEASHDIAGYIGMYVAADEGEITGVAVAEKYRRCGIATALIAEIKKQATSREIRTIFLEVRSSNIPARSLYERQGFVPCGARKNFYRLPTEDAIVMAYSQ